MTKLREKPEERVWSDFQAAENLTDAQLHQFQQYSDLLFEWNEKHNLTAINNLSGVVNQHFTDSLSLRKFFDLNTVSVVADVGPGAGFPLLPLKIMFPHLKIILIEVTHKKQLFLQEVVDVLGLTDVEIAPLDWRTFVRTTEGTIDLFVSRAALDEVELARMFRTNSVYRNATMVYWASNLWECNPKVAQYISEVHNYTVKYKERKLVFFRLPRTE